ncbi:mechanosensitive ion channel family protein [Flavobacterium sp.]|uniref:mechanosensitive ion channel family protein n=1 Tax=Flavobacterium sp. TaxID=239 RepID=UPI003528D6FA
MTKIETIIENWQHSTEDFLPKLLMAILVIILFYFIGKIAKNISLRFYTKVFKSSTAVPNIIASLIFFFFLLSGVFIALQVMGLEKVLTHILAGAGIIGIIAGFAFKDIASNAFAGLLVNTQHPYKIGDWVQIEDIYGVITKIGWITTNIKTVPGQEVYIPNQLVYNNTFTNYSTYGKRRIVLKSGVSYGDDLEQVKKVALDEVTKIPQLLTTDDVDFYFTDIGNSTYNFQLRFWIKFTDNNDYQKAMSDAIVHIKKRFEQENISIAYPVTTLDFGVKGGVNIFDKPISIKQ